MIFNGPSLKSAEINGFVNSRADINKAVEVARGAKVKNDMRLK